MYTYERPFLGFRLSQFENPSKVPGWLAELEELVQMELRLEHLAPNVYDASEYMELSHAQTRVFLEWVVQHHREFRALKFEFQLHYHGDGGEPVIFGRYLDSMYPKKDLHSSSAVKKLERIRGLESEALDLFATLPSSLWKDVKPFVGVGWNRHSS